MSSRTKAGKYFLRGLLIDVFILLAAALGYVVTALATYDGQCGMSFIFGGGHHSCSLVEYLTGDMLFLPLILLLCYWWAIALLFLLPPVAGYLIGRTRVSYR